MESSCARIAFAAWLVLLFGLDELLVEVEMILPLLILVIFATVLERKC